MILLRDQISEARIGRTQGNSIKILERKGRLGSLRKHQGNTQATLSNIITTDLPTENPPQVPK